MGAFFNIHPFGPPRGFTHASSWPWKAHSASGLLNETDALFRLAFAAAPHPQVLSLAAFIKSPDHYAKGTQSGILKSCEISIALPPPVSQLVSGSISLR